VKKNNLKEVRFMGKFLKETLDHLTIAMHEAELQEKRDVKFSVVMDGVFNNRLEYLAEYFGQSKTAMVRELLTSAISDTEEYIGVSMSDPEYYRKVAKEEPWWLNKAEVAKKLGVQSESIKLDSELKVSNNG